jgi:hypothetical protein
MEDEKKIWEITKGYGAESLDDDSSSIGYRIDVYQESINQTIAEYLVNFDYFNRVMTAYGFELITREEAQDMGLPDGSGLFSELFAYMLSEIDKNKFKAKDYEQAPFMSIPEKDISFLNRYFIFKKKINVNTSKVVIEMDDEEDDVDNDIDNVNVDVDVVVKPKEKKKKTIMITPKKAKAKEETTTVDKPTKPKKLKKTLVLSQDS